MLPGDSVGGENYGWRCKEATSCTDQEGCDCEDASFVDPVYEYTHGGSPFRCSVTGGEVYRGCADTRFAGRVLLWGLL